ncbi:MAG: TolC family protein, partial [Candidatus Omnitrophica bacterium]|nr:TolC family protein [Candidatus Omnitrophota bacterium]
TIALVFSIPAHAEEILTLDAALTTAYKENPRVVEARKSMEAAKGDLVTAWALPDPEISFEIGGFKKNEDGNRRLNLDNVGIRQGFLPFGVRGLKRDIAKNGILAQEESVRAVWSVIYLAVRETYNRIILDKKELEVATDNLTILRQFYSRVEIRFQSGKALKNELQRAKIELLDAETKCLWAEKEIKTNKARLNLLLGRPVDTPFDIREELREEDLELDFKELCELALKNRPDIKQEELGLDSKTKTLSRERLSILPSPFVEYDRTTTDYENDSTVSLGMSVPLWGFNRGEMQKAAAQKEAQQIQLEASKRDALLDVYEAYLSAEFIHRQFELLKKSLEEANELLRVADLRFSEGDIDFINFLDQVRTATQTRTKYYKGLFELSNAVSRLEISMYASLRKEEYLK